MKNLINIAVVGLGQVGIYLLNELNTKKKDIELKTGKKINVVAVSARSISKKRRFKVNKKIFFKNPLEIFDKTKVDILFEAIGMSDGISKKVVETALKNIFLLTLNLLFLEIFLAETATTLIFLPVLSSISFFLVLSSFNK